MTILPIIAALALQPFSPESNLAEPVRVEGPSKICIGRVSFEAEAGETVSLDYAGVYWSEIGVEGPSGRFTIRVGDNLSAPRFVLRRPVRGTEHRVVRFPSWDGIDRYLVYGWLVQDRERYRPVARVEGRTDDDEVDRWLLNRIDPAESDPGSCDHRLDYGRRGERG